MMTPEDAARVTVPGFQGRPWWTGLRRGVFEDPNYAHPSEGDLCSQATDYEQAFTTHASGPRNPPALFHRDYLASPS